MPIYIHERHDIGIISPSVTTTVYGLMLATIDGRPAYKTSTERYLKNQYYAGAPDYGALDPQSELPIIMDDHRPGFGLEVAAAADPGRYFSSIGMDLRHRGMAIAGQTPTTVTVPEVYTTTWTDPTGFTDSATAWGAETTAYDANTATYAETTVQVAVSSWSDWLQFDIAATNCGQARVWASVENDDFLNAGGIEVEVFYDGVWNAHNPGVGWHNTWATEDLVADPTQSIVSVTAIKIRLFNNDPANVAHCRIHEVDFGVSTIGSVKAFAEFNDKLYMGKHTGLYELETAGTAMDIVKSDFTVALTDLETFTDDNLYICLGWATAYWACNTANSCTANTLANNTMKYMQTVHTTADTMYGSDSNSTIRSILLPSGTVAWSATTQVGADYHDITDLLDKAGALYIPKEDMIYYLDSEGAVKNDLAPRLQALTRSTSGKNALTDGEIIMYPAGDQGLLEIGTSLTWRNPSGYCTNLSDFVGRVTAVAFDEEYWFIAVDNDPKAGILAGRLETINGTTSFVWHPIAEITLSAGATVETMFVSSVFQKRLWVASTDSSDSLYYIPLTGYGDVANDANRKFKDGSLFITSGQHGGFKGENKYWRKATATLGHTYDANKYFELHYMKLGAGDYSDPAATTWIDVGDFKGSTASMTQTLYFAANTAGDTPVTPMMWFKVVAKTNTTGITPILLNLDIRAILKPEARKIIECVVRCADNIQDKDGDYLEGTGAADIRTILDEARDATSPFTFYDPWGTSHTCIMLPVEPESEFQTDLKGENPEQWYYLKMQEVALS